MAGKGLGQEIVVVGAGMAGMVAALYLQRSGMRVTVLEQNHHAGGNMSGFQRKGFYFDGGDQSFESLGIVFPILEDLGIYHQVEWSQVRYRMASADFDFFIDNLSSAEEALSAAFPDELGIKPVFAEVRRVCAFLDKFCDARSFPALNATTLPRLMSFIPHLPDLRRWLTFDYRKKVCEQIRNPALRHWLGEIGYQRMPFIFFAGFWNLWYKDYWYPVGGMQALFDLMVKTFQDWGGTIRFNTPIQRIATESRLAKGVLTQDGEFIRADQVVYAADYKALLAGILDPELFPARRRSTVAAAPLTESLVAAYLGVDIPPEILQERLQSHHAFWFPDYAVTFPDTASPANVHGGMWSVINFFGTENRNFAPEGHSTLVLQTYSSAPWQDWWRNGSIDGKRNQAYRELKEQVGRELIASARHFLPDLEEHIVWQDVGTPLSINRFSRNSEGSTGGWQYDDRTSLSYKAPFFNMIGTPVRNVHAAGHYAVWPGGVISAALSGRLVANRVQGKPLLSPLGGKR